MCMPCSYDTMKQYYQLKVENSDQTTSRFSPVNITLAGYSVCDIYACVCVGGGVI
jgi:hypothetical protein